MTGDLVQSCPYTSLTDAALMALCIWREARGESELGRRGVAWVIYNRVVHNSYFGDSIQTVILKPWQFSSFNENDPNERLWPADNDQAYLEIQNIATSVLNGTDDDPTDGATSYFDVSIPAPAWAATMKLTLETGRLRFFKLNAGTAS